MGKFYRETMGELGEPTTQPTMRMFFQQPGKSDENGKPIYFTEQSHKKECDINNIIRKYDKHGIITHVSKFEASYGDLTGLDFKQAKDLVINAQNSFNELPANIRQYFENSPEKLLTFMEDPQNRDKAIELGLIQNDWSPATDGIGEHIKNDSERVLEKPTPPVE